MQAFRIITGEPRSMIFYGGLFGGGGGKSSAPPPPPPAPAPTPPPVSDQSNVDKGDNPETLRNIQQQRAELSAEKNKQSLLNESEDNAAAIKKKTLLGE